jgi:protein N-terminal methyltransferase
MGGFANISMGDVAGSKKLIEDMKCLPGGLETGYALDCGAGIGRVAKRLLLPLFDKVDLVEQNPIFLEKAKTYIGASVSRVGEFYVCGLQDFIPESNRYNVIWCQWVLSHLTDKDMVKFFGRCVGSLREGGVIVVKENIAEGVSVHDAKDSSISRTEEEFKDIFSSSQLDIILERRQDNFPKELFDVYMFVLRPKSSL